MNKDQSTKEELKVQVVDLTTDIEQWTSTKEEGLEKSSAPPSHHLHYFRKRIIVRWRKGRTRPSP